MPSDDARKPPQRYRQRMRMIATILSGAFALPVLFVFGVAVRELSRPPEPSIYAAPSPPPETSTNTTSPPVPTQDPSRPTDTP